MRTLVVLLAFASACYSPSYGDCQLSCAGGTCPTGYDCTAGMCRLHGLTGPCQVTGDDDAGVDAPSEIPIDMLQDAQNNAFCARLVRCGAQDDMASCLDVYDAFIRSNLQDVAAAVAAGKIVYHGDRAARCIEFLTNLPCVRDAYASVANPDCATVFEGTLTDGQACALSNECVSQSCTVPGNCPSACCQGTCNGSTPPATKTVGQPCTGADVCTGGYCSPTGVCAAYADNGAACNSGERCKPGSICHQNGTSFNCQQLSVTDTACAATNECKLLSDVCVSSTCKTTGLNGTSCGNVTECQELHQCANNVTCAPAPTLNESCANVGVCREGYCEQFTMVCVPSKADDQACESTYGGRDCMSGYCDTTLANPRCAPDPICI